VLVPLKRRIEEMESLPFELMDYRRRGERERREGENVRVRTSMS
jgi:hypothetical protein